MQRISRLAVVLVGVMGLTLAAHRGPAQVHAQATGGFPPSLTANLNINALGGPLAIQGFQLSGPLTMSFPNPSSGNFTATFATNLNGAQVEIPMTGSVNDRSMSLTFSLGSQDVVWGNGVTMAPLSPFNPASFTVGGSTFGVPGNLMAGGSWMSAVGNYGNWYVSFGM